MLRQLILLVLAALLAACGGSLNGILKDNPLCTEKCDDKKMYRDLGCGCRCMEGLCPSGQVADKNDGCRCKVDNTPSYPAQPLSTFGAACACVTPDGYVNTHNIACFPPQQVPKKGSIVTVIAPPTSANSSSVCTAQCGASAEMHGAFRMTVDHSICLVGGVVAGFRQNISGYLFNEVTRSDFFELRKLEMGDALSRRSPVRATLTAGRPSDASPSVVSAPRFLVSEAGLECKTECAKDSPLCTRMNLDSKNSQHVRALLAALPTFPVTKRMSSAYIGSTLRASPTCRRDDLRFIDNVVQNDGEACSEPLHLDMPGVANFSIRVRIPRKVSGNVEYSETERRVSFASPEQMVALEVTPQGAHDVVGGRIRFVSATSSEIVAEVENGCLAVGLR